MDGVLLVDKPSGLTSHDAVARLRRTSGERRIGHTGTLDPRATGLLPLVFGSATRLASLLSGIDKTYDATVHLGISTDTDDAEGTPIGPVNAALPPDTRIAAVLEIFRGTFEQMPPRHSAKKVGGERAYDLARRAAPVELRPVTVTVRALDILSRTGDLLEIRVTATSGFYVRALARDLGSALGCGAHLAGLRRTHCGHFSIDAALGLAEAERLGPDVAPHLLTPDAALPHLAAVSVNEAGLRRATHGNALGPEHLTGRWIPPTRPDPVKVLDANGRLIALAHARGGALHPAIVLIT